MFHVIMYQPEIPPNTGNVIRLCANVGARLHLVHPLGFSMEAARLRRAGLDYREMATVTEHDELTTCLADFVPQRVFALTTKASRPYQEVAFQAGDAFLFGPETRGLPDDVLALVPADRQLRVPMRPGNRSLNLSNTVAVVVYEAWRQLAFVGAS